MSTSDSIASYPESPGDFTSEGITESIRKYKLAVSPTPIGSISQNIEVRKVSNGYIIMPQVAISSTMEPLVVFNDFYDMMNWLREHFNEPSPVEEEIPF